MLRKIKDKRKTLDIFVISSLYNAELNDHRNKIERDLSISNITRLSGICMLLID